MFALAVVGIYSNWDIRGDLTVEVSAHRLMCEIYPSEGRLRSKIKTGSAAKVIGNMVV